MSKMDIEKAIVKLYYKDGRMMWTYLDEFIEVVIREDRREDFRQYTEAHPGEVFNWADQFMVVVIPAGEYGSKLVYMMMGQELYMDMTAIKREV